MLNEDGEVDEAATLVLRAARPTSAPAVFDRGGEIAALKARCLAETGLPPPSVPVAGRTRRGAAGTAA